MRVCRLCWIGVLAGLTTATLARAQDEIGDSRRNAIVRAIEVAEPAVVSVNVVELEAQRVFDPFERDFWNFFDLQPRYQFRQRKVDSVGSGFLFDHQGHILTNFHVIEGTERPASVSLPDGRELEVSLVGVDERTDLAVLQAKGENLPAVKLGRSNDLLIGEWVIAIGNPFGPLITDPQPTVSVGVVSANRRRLSPEIGGGERLYQSMIQTDAAINPGNSGGPLVNAQGEVVGVNTMIFSRSGGNIGLGFAIPIDRAKRVADEIIRYGHRRDPWPGFQVGDVRDMRPDLQREVGVAQQSGCIVVNILRGCPAYEAGLRPGDVIVSINNAPMRVCSDVDFAIWDLFVGDTAALEFDRQGKRFSIQFPVQELDKGAGA